MKLTKVVKRCSFVESDMNGLIAVDICTSYVILVSKSGEKLEFKPMTRVCFSRDSATEPEEACGSLNN